MKPKHVTPDSMPWDSRLAAATTPEVGLMEHCSLDAT